MGIPYTKQSSWGPRDLSLRSLLPFRRRREPIITDFGDAQLGDPPFCEEVTADVYRAPEIMLGIA
ncbi:hypothetical protein L209DRAFT_753762 [Thermothelomyces heterothallicus CBS 203.75]